jgi:hypothetical protein
MSDNDDAITLFPASRPFCTVCRRRLQANAAGIMRVYIMLCSVCITYASVSLHDRGLTAALTIIAFRPAFRD